MGSGVDALLAVLRKLGQGLTGRDRGSVAYLTGVDVSCCCLLDFSVGWAIVTVSSLLSAGGAPDVVPQNEVSIMAGDGHRLGDRIDFRSRSDVPAK